MTQDTDPGHFYTTPPRKSYNPFDSDDDTLEPTDLKSPIVFAKEDCIGYDLKTLEESANALTFDVDKGEFSWEAALLGQPAVGAAANGYAVLLDKDGHLYTDKNVTECEAPEFIICCKESSYQSVKDIGIDEGVLMHDKKWDQSGKDEKKSDEFDVLEHPKADGLSQEVKTEQNDDSLKITEQKLDLEAQGPFPVEKAAKTAEFADETDPKGNDFEHGEPDWMVKDEAIHGGTNEEKMNNISTDRVDKIAGWEPNTGTTPSKHPTENEQGKGKPNEVPITNEILPASDHAPPVQESVSTSHSNNSPANTNPLNHQDDQETIEAAKPPAAQAMTRHTEPLHEEPVVHSSSSISSFPPASSITFSGPVSYSGSISLRSESSAGSTRSFAFPVLQAEWNSSPVRMAKADDRQKQRGWLQGLICCWL